VRAAALFLNEVARRRPRQNMRRKRAKIRLINGNFGHAHCFLEGIFSRFIPRCFESLRQLALLLADKAAICAGMTTMIDNADRASPTAFATTCGCRAIDRTLELHSRFSRAPRLIKMLTGWLERLISRGFSYCKNHRADGFRELGRQSIDRDYHFILGRTAKKVRAG